jgi:hypothetical protein
MALAAGVSCGGSTRENPGSGGSSGRAGGAGVSGSAGAGGQDGTGGSGAGGSGGSAGMPDRCTKPSESGNCNAYFPAFFHNAATGVCEPFVYGGCGGNDNRFETREACQAACRGGAQDMDACTQTNECMALEVGCCGSCEQGNDHSFVAINRKHYDAFSQTRTCPGIVCGSCPDVDELMTTSQYFGSICLEGACTIVDIRESAATECTGGSECQLRDGAACCEGCDGRGLVSVRPQAFVDLLCANALEQACPPCAPMIPPEFVPTCTTGRCRVTRLRR